MSTDVDQRSQNAFLVDAGEMIASRSREIGRHYPFGAGKSLAMATVASKQPYVDRSAMSARFTISTATVDRVGDLLIPMGCNVKNYSKNPAVFWAHGIEGISTPIGTSNDPNGNLHVTITEDEVQATWFCAQSSLEACQIFELTDEGVIKACSVRETPMSSRLVMREGQQILLVDEWELEEWSPCGLGVNPDAVAKAIHKNRLGGQPIAESIMKSLMAVAPPKKILGVGFTETKSMSEDKKTPETTPADEGNNMSNQAPYGAQAISSVHAGLSSLTKCGDTSMKAMEHPVATPGLKGCIDRLKDEVTYLKGLHAECYPNSKLKDDMESDGEAGDSEMKAFLASGQRYQWQMGGIAAQLKSMSCESNLTPAQRRQLDGLASSLDRVLTQAKSFVAKTPVAPETNQERNQVSADEQEKLDAAFAKLTAS